MEMPADLDFFTILVDFGGQVGKENRAKTGQDRARQGKIGQDKTRQRPRQDKTRLWLTKRRGGTFALGGGFAPLLGGYSPRLWTPGAATR